MTSYRWWCVAMVMIVALVVPRAARAQGVETVIEWNRLLQVTLATPGALPPTVFFPRSLAMVHVAIFDALNAIEFRYTPYASRVDVAPGASPDAAVAQAAHDVLVALFPARREIYDAALARDLGRIQGDAARDGARVGAAAARALLELRARDGWERVPPPFQVPSLAGFWQPTPPQNLPAGFTHYPDVMGFVSETAHAYLVEPPPALTSAAYATALNQVKAIGGTTSSTRTEDQTLVARLWHGVGTTTPFQNIWNNVVRDLARAGSWSALDTARVYALLNMTFHDALRASFTGKYVYGLWRPVTAIRNADRDGNAATEADPTWTPLITTPPYPAYPGNMACVGASLSRLLARAVGRDDVRFTAMWEQAEGPWWTRVYGGFHQMGDEQARSRIYGGIHFPFDTTASFGVCPRVADYAFENHLRPRFQ